MSRRVLTLAVAAALAVTVVTVAVSANAPFSITEAQASFPERSFVLTLPSATQLNRRQIEVRENGERVRGVSLLAAGAASAAQFATVLVIDASLSMRGKPIVGALAAARAFAAHRNPKQQLAVVTVNRTANVLLPLTTDPARIEATLAQRPKLVYGTHIYDGVASAVRLLRTSKIRAGSIVLLSDGADTGSTLSEGAAARAARAARVRVFSVGLRSPFFAQQALRQLATDAGGRYSEATSPTQLRQIYGALGAELAREYLIRYRSDAPPGRKIDVAVRVRGLPGLAVTGYRSPGLETIRRRGTYHESFAHKLWSSPLTMVFIALLSAALVALGVVAVAGTRRPGTLRRRMSEFVTLPTKERASAVVADRVLDGTERVLGGTRWWSRFRNELELAGISTPPDRIVVFTFIVTFIAIWLLSVITGSLLLGMLGLGIPFVVRSYVKRKVERTRRLFSEQLPDNLQVLASALRAGHSFIGALSVVVDDAPEPSRSEFRRVIGDEQLGVPLEDALHVVVERMDSAELEQVAVVASLQRQSGGNTAEVLDRVTETIRERFELRRTIRTLTAQGRLSRWIVSSLPLFLVIMISLVNPRYMHTLYASSVGKVALVLAAVMVIAGSLVIRRIVNIKV